MKKTAAFLFTLFVGSTFAYAEDPMNKVGIMFGNVSVSGDNLTSSGISNAIGYGAFLDFAASDVFEMEFSLLYSSHPGTGSVKLTQTDIAVGPIFKFGEYDVAVPFVIGGVNLISRSLDAGAGSSGSATGFGLHAGIGVDFVINEQFVAGLVARYVNAFDQNVTIGGTSMKLITPHTDVLARLGFRF